MAGPGKIYLNDDVLMEILVLLPPKSVFKFKLVSSHWRSLLSSPDFLRRHAAAHPGKAFLVAFIQKAAVHETSSTIMANHCNPLPICNPLGKRFLNLKIPIDVGHFLNSYDGLILCSRSRGTFVTYHVGNPHTGRFVDLPQPWRDNSCQSAGLICGFDDDGSYVYFVLRARMPYLHENNEVDVDAYCSKTGEWSRGFGNLVATGNFMLSEEPPLVVNGIVHWYTESGDIAVYYPIGRSGTHVQLIRVPYLRKDKNICYAVTRGDDNVLWLAVLRRKNLLLYKLPKELDYERSVDIDSKEWELVRDVRIADISKLMKRGLIACEGCTLEFLIEMKSEIVAVLQQKGKVFLYNLHRESIEKLDYQGCYNKGHRLCPYFRSTRLAPHFL